jgi:protein phosphatase
MEAEIHATTGTGPIRKWNEDNYLLLQLSTSKFWTKSSDEYVIKSLKFEIDENGIVLAVSDGLGEIASEIAVDAVKNMLTGEVLDVEQSFYEGELIEKLYDATLYANRLTHHEGRTNPQFNGMGCTLTAAGIANEAVDLLQVGDTRGYLVRNGKIYQVTKDQSLVCQLIDEGKIAPEEAETHPLKNVILQALGAQNEIYPVPVRLIPNRDDILLLCSDGLSNKLPAEDLVRIILDNFSDLENACKTLIQEANERGGEDNITVILAKLSGNDLIEPTDDPVVIYPLIFDNQNSGDQEAEI